MNKIIAQNVSNKIFNEPTDFERCNITNCTFNAECYCDRCNIINCTNTYNCICEKSNIINEDEEERPEEEIIEA